MTTSITSRFVSATFALALTAALGCSSDPTHDADFRDLDDTQRGALAGMVVSGPLLGAFIIWGAEFDSQQGDCPAKSVDGDTVTYTGGCTTAEGTRYEGVIRGTNVSTDLFEPTPNPSAPSSFEFTDFLVFGGNDDGSETIIDGRLDISIANPEPGDAYVMSYDYSVSISGADITEGFSLDATFDCADRCTAAAGASGSLDSIGEFGLSGSWGFEEVGEDQVMVGRLVLSGAQELVIDYGAQGPECVVFEVDGAAAGTLCEEPEE